MAQLMLSMPARVRPPLAAGALADRHYERLTAWQRHAVVGAIAVAHVAAMWALLQVREVREAVAQVAPMFVSLVAPPEPAKIEPPPPRPPQVERRIAPQPRLITAAPSPAPAPFVTPAPPVEPIEPPPPAVVAAAPAPIVAPPPVAPPPRTIPASAVQYLEPLPLDYPRLSKRLGESGRVVVRVFIDEAGAARDVQVQRTSGHSRLDDAATAAVRKARFKPYSENGQAVAGWALIPIDFELER